MERCKWTRPNVRVHGLTLHASPKLYFVKVDVKSAFDSIKLDKMFEVLDEVLNMVR